MTSAADFFAYARERHNTYIRRQAEYPRPWSTDPIIQSNRFTNVFRELDRTTLWFAKHVRGPLRDKPEVLLATVIFRWFNRISTGEAIFCHPGLEGYTGFEKYLVTGRVSDLKDDILEYCGKAGPYVTGAYTINTNRAPRGTSKLDGVLYLIERWVEAHPNWLQSANEMIHNPVPLSLREFCRWVQGECLGGFMAYEIACDLRWTALLERAPDISTWANPGPGAIRGLNRIFGRRSEGRDPWSKSIPIDQACAEMQGLLAESRHAWPSVWPAWEMREVEHTLCEYDKYCRIKAGDGRTRGSFNGR